MQTCLLVAPWICGDFNDYVGIWDITISVVTIVASVLGALIVTRIEIARDRRSRQYGRRVEAIAAFGELGATAILDVLRGAGDEMLVHGYQHMSRISLHTRTAEVGMHDWMQAAFDGLVVKLGAAISATPAGAEPDVDEAMEYYRQRLEDLRGWPGSTESWEKYIAGASRRG